MEAFCPNLNNKNIKAEFEELKSALGEDLAYLLWHRTEGEGLGNHPGLADSAQFANLVSETGSRKLALKRAANQILNKQFNKEDANVSINSITISQNIENNRNEYIKSVVEGYKKDSKLEGQQLSDAIMRIQDRAREQFDLNELNKIKDDGSMSDAEKQISFALLYRDLEITKGIQRINEIAEKTTDQKVFEQIKQGTKTRLKSQLSRNIKQTKLINDLKEQIANLEGVNENDIDQMFEQIKQFLLNAEQEILKTKRFMNEQLIGKDISTWDPQQINYIRYDFLGYYDDCITESEKKILDKEGFKKKESGSDDPMNVSKKKKKKNK